MNKTKIAFFFLLTSVSFAGTYTTDDLITKGPWVDVRAYGAVGDGTDDTVAIQAAAIAAAGGTLFFPPTSDYYLTTNPIVLSSNTHIEGCGYGSYCFIETADDDGESFFEATGKTNIHISDLRMGSDNVGVGIFGLTGIKFDTCTYVSTNNIWADTITGATIELTDCTYFSIKNTFLGSSVVAGIVAYEDCSRGVIDGVWSDGGAAYFPIDIEMTGATPPSDIIITNFHIKDSPYPGIGLADANNILISNGDIEGSLDATRGSIECRGGDNLQFNNVRIKDGAQFGIYMWSGCTRVSLTNVHTSGNASGGVGINNTTAPCSSILIDKSCIFEEANKVVNNDWGSNLGVIDNSLDEDYAAQQSMSVLPCMYFADIKSGGTIFANWTNNLGAGVTLAQDESVLHSVRSLKITKDTGDDWTHVSYALPTYLVNQLRGRHLSGIFVAKGDAGNTGVPRIEVNDGTAHWFIWDNTTTIFSANVFSVPIAVAATSVTIRIYTDYGTGGSTDINYFDSLFLSIGNPSYYIEKEFWASGAPAVGTWLKGYKVWNITPSAAGNIGWVCTAGGTPGTWRTFGVIGGVLEYLLLETGDYLLLETGDKIKLESSI